MYNHNVSVVDHFLFMGMFVAGMYLVQKVSIHAGFKKSIIFFPTIKNNLHPTSALIVYCEDNCDSGKSHRIAYCT